MTYSSPAAKWGEDPQLWTALRGHEANSWGSGQSMGISHDGWMLRLGPETECFEKQRSKLGRRESSLAPCLCLVGHFVDLRNWQDPWLV